MVQSKKTVAAAIVALGSLVGTGAQAFELDTLIGSAALGNSSVAAEESALEAAIALYSGSAVDVNFDSKVEADIVVAPNGIDSWYIDINPATVGYFVLKFGTGSFPKGTPDTYFFQNIAELDKLVWSNAQVNFLSGGCGEGACNTGRLSHYTLFDGGNGGGGGGGGGDTPEPATLALLGLGLLAAGAASRRRKG